MADRLPVESTGNWTFHLHQAQNLQFRIASKQGADAHVIIEGHEISLLLDYLYENRELIYKATHDSEGRHLEALKAFDGTVAEPHEKWQVERIFYIDDGEGRKQTMPG